MFTIADAIKNNLIRANTNAVEAHSAGQSLRNRKLPPETIIHLLIGADGGSFAKELHRAGIDATPAAVSQRRAVIPPDVFRERNLKAKGFVGFAYRVAA